LGPGYRVTTRGSAREQALLQLVEFVIGQNFGVVQFGEFLQLRSDTRCWPAQRPMGGSHRLRVNSLYALLVAGAESGADGTPGHICQGHLAEQRSGRTREHRRRPTGAGHRQNGD
jgi:hypothetical protein